MGNTINTWIKNGETSGFLLLNPIQERKSEKKRISNTDEEDDVYRKMMLKNGFLDPIR